MLIKLFRQDRPLAFLVLPVLLLLLWPGAGTDWTGLQAGAVPIGMPLYAPLHWLISLSPWLAAAIGLLLALGLSLRVDRLANDSGVLGPRNHFPALLLPILLALFPQGLFPGPAFIGGWAVLGALSVTWGAMDRMRVLSPLFDAGLLLGLASLFYLPYGLLIVAVWSSIAMNRAFNWREYALPLFGLAVMLFLGWGATRLIDPALWGPSASMRPVSHLAIAPLHWMHGVLLTVFLGAAAIAVAWSLPKVQARSVMRERKVRASLLVFVFLMGLLALLAWRLGHQVPATLLAVPGALLLSFPLLGARRTAWAEALVWGLLLLALWARWAA